MAHVILQPMGGSVAQRRAWIVGFASIMLAGTALPSVAMAQQRGAESEPQSQQSAGANDIIVTARKTNESIQEVPVAVTAMTGDTLAKNNIRSLDSLAGVVPNFQFDTGAAVSASTFATTAFIRGVGQNDYAVFTDPGVGLYVDGVYMARSLGAALDNFEIERVEVLRGPQGTLFGKNTIGGAVNVVMRKPGNSLGGYIEGATGSFNKTFLQGAIDLPLSTDIKSRFAVGYFNQGGYSRRLTDGIRQGNKDNILLRGTMVYDPGSAFKLEVAGDYMHGKSDGAPLTLGGVQSTGLFIQLFNQLVAPTSGIVAPNGSPTYNSSFVTGDPYTTYGASSVRNTLESYGVAATVELDLDAATLKSITAYRYLKGSWDRDGDASPFKFRENRQLETSKQFSQEFQLTGSALGDRLKYVAGAYYFHEEGYDQVYLILADGLYQALEALPGPLANGFGGKGNPLNIVLDNVLFDTNVVRNTTYALYANLNFKLTDWLSLEGGLRQNWDSKSLDPVHLRIASGVYIAPPGSHFATDFKSFTPRFGIKADVSRDLNFYASYSKGFKSGGFNARPLVSIAEINLYQPESVGSYEIGMKSRWFDRHLVLNVAAFSANYKNIQLPVNQPPQNFVFNAGSGRIKGIEAETTIRIGQNFSINGSLGYLDAKYTQIGGNLAPGQFIPITLASKFIKAPKVTWTVGAHYDLPLSSGGKFSLGADYTHKSSYFNDVANSPQVFQPGYGLLGARLSYTTPDDRVIFALSGTNLTDERYLIAGNVAGASLGSLVEESFGAPREWEFSVRYKF
jgi:iron complex outermembrane receptor protein